VTNNGTGVAGTCPKCRLYNVKVIGDNGKGTVSSLVRGITWSTNHGAEVINMSLGTHNGSKALKDAVDYAWKKGVVLVAAAGNYHSRDRFYPAAYSHVIAVGATNDKDAKPKFSDYGRKWVDIGAPGVDILSTLPGDRYGVESGTSMATPHVAGAAGLVWSTNRCAADDNTCVRNRIEDGADQISGLRKYWPDGRRLNALNSVSP
jgi:thermitase